MSFWDRVRAWLSGGPERVPDVASFGDAKLSALWKERDELTDTAREAVRAECLRRGLKLRGLVQKSDSEAPRAAPADHQAPMLDPVPREPGPPRPLMHLQRGAEVLLSTTPGRWALVLLPRWSPLPIEPLPGFPLDAVIVCNHERRGWLDATTRAAGLPLYATAEGPIDRTPAAPATGEATLLPGELRLGTLTLRRMPGRLSDVLRASWSDAEPTVTLGPTLPEALVGAKPESRVYLGSLPMAGHPPAWSALLAAAHASAMMSSLSGGGAATGPVVLLAADAVGTTLRHHTHLLPGFGITVVGTQCPIGLDAIVPLGAVHAGRWDDAVRGVPAVALEDLAEHLVVESRLDDARRLVDAALAARSQPLFHRLDALLLALSGRLDAAVAAIARAEDDAFTPVVAAALHAARGELDEAEQAARLGLSRLPRDPDAIEALVRVLWLAGRTDDARRVIDDAPPLSLTGTRASDMYAVIEAPPPEASVRRLSLPHLAARAIAAARRAEDREHAIVAGQRAVQLDPYSGPVLGGAPA